MVLRFFFVLLIVITKSGVSQFKIEFSPYSINLIDPTKQYTYTFTDELRTKINRSTLGQVSCGYYSRKNNWEHGGGIGYRFTTYSFNHQGDIIGGYDPANISEKLNNLTKYDYHQLTYSLKLGYWFGKNYIGVGGNISRIIHSKFENDLTQYDSQVYQKKILYVYPDGTTGEGKYNLSVYHYTADPASRFSWINFEYGYAISNRFTISSNIDLNFWGNNRIDALEVTETIDWDPTRYLLITRISDKTLCLRFSLIWTLNKD